MQEVGRYHRIGSQQAKSLSGLTSELSSIDQQIENMALDSR